MGLFDAISDTIENVTGANIDESHEWGNGFDPDVCRGCPFEGQVLRGAAIGCQKCGCPHYSLEKSQAPPSSCPRLEHHRR